MVVVFVVTAHGVTHLARNFMLLLFEGRFGVICHFPLRWTKEFQRAVVA